MRRRTFIKKIGLGSLAGLSLSGCGQSETAKQDNTDRMKNQSKQVFDWKMVTTWPKNYPIYGTAIENFSKLVYQMSSGRLNIKVYGGGELLPALEALDAVSKNAVQLAHSAAFYWAGRNPAFQFFSAVPFGMNATQMDAWLYSGGGMELWREAYAPFNVIPIPAGNTGLQMAGWFNREINSIQDLKGLKMRIPGLGGYVLNQVGGTAVTLPGAELLTAMQTRIVDAAEWVNPYLDLAFGLHKVAKYYYYPGWQEPGAALECIVNRDAMNSLPEDLQAIIYTALRHVSIAIETESIAKNGQAVRRIKNMDKVELRRLPDEVLEELRKVALRSARDIAQTSEFALKVYNSYTGFMKETKVWLDLSEKIYYDVLSK